MIKIYDNLLKDICSDDTSIQTEAAFELNSLKFSHECLVEFIKSADQNLKYIGLLKIEELKNKEEADLVVNCLTKNESRIRELSSFKLKFFIEKEEHMQYFQCESSMGTFFDAITDVNPKVCKNATNLLKYADKKLTLLKKALDIILFTMEKIKSYRYHHDQDYRRLTFSLYWNLEALNCLTSDKKINLNDIIDQLIEILTATSKYKDYTIREKTAVLISILSDYDFSAETKIKIQSLSRLLSKDENFFVKHNIISN